MLISWSIVVCSGVPMRRDSLPSQRNVLTFARWDAVKWVWMRSHDIMWPCVRSCDAMWYHVTTWDHVMLCDIMWPREIMWCHVTSCDHVWDHVMWDYTTYGSTFIVPILFHVPLSPIGWPIRWRCHAFRQRSPGSIMAIIISPKLYWKKYLLPLAQLQTATNLWYFFQ